MDRGDQWAFNLSCRLRVRHFLLSMVPSLLLAKFTPNPLEVRGQKLFYRIGDIKGGIIFPLLVFGEYEPRTTQWISRILSSGMTMVDVGAHIGYHTLNAARSVAPGGRVYAFEPIPSTAEILNKNVEVNGYSAIVQVVQKAVSDSSGRMEIYYRDARLTGMATLISPRYLGRAFSTLSVETTSLDAFFSRIGWPSVDLVKIDVEGAEVRVLKGMSELARRNPGLKILAEIHDGMGVMVEELAGILASFGFTKIRLWHEHKGEEILLEKLELLPQVLRPPFVDKMLCERGQ